MVSIEVGLGLLFKASCANNGIENDNMNTNDKQGNSRFCIILSA